MDKEKKRGPLFRLLAFLITTALVLGAVFLVANWQKLNFDFIRRYFTYRSLERNESGQVQSFPHGGGANSAFAQLGDDLLVCSASWIRLYSPSGTAYVDQPCHLAHPVLTTGGGTALVYDTGGSDLFVYKDRELVFSLSAQEGDCILSAGLSAQGLLTVVTQTSGLKGAVSVYDSEFQKKMDVNISSRFVTDAALSPDGSTLALATSGQDGGIYDSQIAFYDLDRAAEEQQADAVCSLGNNATLSLSWTSGPLRVLGENALTLVNADGSQAGSYFYNWRYLKGFSMDGEGYCCLLLGKYRAGTDADLVTVDLSGEEIACQSMDQQVLSISSAGRYLSILTADGLNIYTSDLELYHALAEPPGTRKVLQRPDGSVTLISGDNSQLYLPE